MRSITLFLCLAAAAAGACGPPRANEIEVAPGVARADASPPVRTPVRPSVEPVTVAAAASGTVVRTEPVASPIALTVESSAFGEGGDLPSKYTSDGANVSPPLSWTAGPMTTTSYALVVTDPDADAGTWTHWVIWNVSATRLDESVPGTPHLPNNAAQGTNSWKRIGYGGPQPPVGGGAHRYVFHVYALDVRLELGAETDRAALENAISGHVVASGELTGRYARTK